MRNTELCSKYLYYVSEFYRTKDRALLGRIINLRHALTSAGCFTRSKERMKWKCFIADNMRRVKKYIDTATKVKSYSSLPFYRVLKANKCPTKPSTLKNLVSLIEKSIVRREKIKNHRPGKGQPLPLKYAVAAIVQDEDYIDQDTIDKELVSDFLRAANQ